MIGDVKRIRTKELPKGKQSVQDTCAKRTGKWWHWCQRTFSVSRPSENVFCRIVATVKSMIVIIRLTKFRLALKPLLYKSHQKLKQLLLSSVMSASTYNTKMAATSSVVSTSVDPSTATKPSILLVTMNFMHRFLMLCVRFVLAKYYGEHGESMPAINDLILLESATALAEKIRTKKVSCVDVMNSFIARCKHVNPLLNCVVDERYDGALAEAEQADQLLASDRYTVDELREQKPFLGVPISTKDCIEVNGMLHTSGLWLRRNTRGTVDADAIAVMRAAGAIPFVLTNVSECCMW